MTIMCLKQFRIHHKKGPKGSEILGGGETIQALEGSNFKRALSKQETWWIYEATMYYAGLNVDIL